MTDTIEWRGETWAVVDGHDPYRKVSSFTYLAPEDEVRWCAKYPGWRPIDFGGFISEPVFRRKRLLLQMEVHALRCEGRMEEADALEWP